MNADDEGYRAIIDKRHVARRACLLCRSKKIKCDGEAMEMRLDIGGGPLTCSNCESSGLECVFIKSRRGGRRKRKSISQVPPGEVVMLLLPPVMSKRKAMHRQNSQHAMTRGEYGRRYMVPLPTPHYQVYTSHPIQTSNFFGRDMGYHPDYGMPTPQDFGDTQPGKYPTLLVSPFSAKSDCNRYATPSTIPRMVLPPVRRPISALDGVQPKQFAFGRSEGTRAELSPTTWAAAQNMNELKHLFANPLPTKLPTILPNPIIAKESFGSTGSSPTNSTAMIQARQTPPQLFRKTKHQLFAVENERVVLPQPLGFDAGASTYQYSKPYFNAGLGDAGNYVSASLSRTLIRP